MSRSKDPRRKQNPANVVRAPLIEGDWRGEGGGVERGREPSRSLRRKPEGPKVFNMPVVGVLVNSSS